MNSPLTDLVVAALLVTASAASAQTTPRSVTEVLAPSIQPVAVTAYQVQRYLMARIPKLPAPSSSADWTAQARKLREHILHDIAFHGWPRQWVDAGPRFEQVGPAQNGDGYRWKKLRYEIVPGYWSTAILYEPEGARGRVPAILNVNGHDPLGKAAEYKQKRCINFARRGILALNLEWPGYGELSLKEDAHDDAADLDLVGSNALGFFYLAMRRGLDYIAQLPEVDPSRLGVTGLSGGGWQTIVLSALDPRVQVMVEVAGFGSLQSNITHPVDTDEVEETPADFLAGEDYTDLVAMRAPRPTLLIHNAEDNCCFRASLVKPYIYDEIKPFFRLFGSEQDLAFYVNRNPGTHNYQVDNRLQAYRFFSEHFHLPLVTQELPAGAEIESFDALKVGVPADNLTTLGLARKLASEISRPPVPAGSAARQSWAASERVTLKSVIRYKPVAVAHAWRMWNTEHLGLESISCRFDFSNHLSATGVWLKGIAAPDRAPATIVLDDRGRKGAGVAVSDAVNRDEQVLALDLLFNGDTLPQAPDPADYELLVASLGDRPLGIEVAQLIAAAQWLEQTTGQDRVRIEADGIRSQVVALAAAALENHLFSAVAVRHGMRSLGDLIDQAIPFRSAPELFCLDLYKDFDLDRFVAMASPAKVTETDFAKTNAAP